LFARSTAHSRRVLKRFCHALRLSWSNSVSGGVPGNASDDEEKGATKGLSALREEGEVNCRL